jgi:glycosyltransferase involved in cell wall biosynthesis
MRVFLLYYIIAYAHTVAISAKPLVAVVLMVKNEASVITQTLQPYIDGGIQDFVVYDTGSTDGTQYIAHNLFETYGLQNAHVIEEPFIDFSTSRNHAIEAAETIFPEIPFILMPDAEWYMHGVDELIQFCADNVLSVESSYLISIRNDHCSFYTTRLMRSHKNVRFVGPVHEVLNRLTITRLPDTCYFEWGSSKNGKEKTAQRWQRDKILLLQGLDKNPRDPRTLFYLAQTYDCLGELDNAFNYYLQRTMINGWPEENYMAWYRLGLVAQRLASSSGNQTFPSALECYLKAYAVRPKRAEPLVQIAHYYLMHNEVQKALEYAQRATEIPYPIPDILFVDSYLYFFERYELLAKCALRAGNYELAQWAIQEALMAKPDAIYLQMMLKCYLNA